MCAGGGLRQKMGVNGENMEDKRGVSDLWGGEETPFAPPRKMGVEIKWARSRVKRERKMQAWKEELWKIDHGIIPLLN